MKAKVLTDPLTAADPPLAKVPRQWVGLKLAHEAAMLDDVQKTLRASRETAAAHARRTFGADLQPEPDADMIHVGDQTTHVHAPAPLPVPPGVGKGLVAALAGLALLAGGGGALGLVALLRPAAAIVAPVVPALVRPAYDAVYEEQLPDGSWREIKRERLK